VALVPRRPVPGQPEIRQLRPVILQSIIQSKGISCQLPPFPCIGSIW
jgi:hypothetical protein